MAQGSQPLRLLALGDGAVLAEFSVTLDLEVNARIRRLAEAIRRRRAPWIRDVVPALGSLALHVDPWQLDAEDIDPLAEAAALIEDCLGHPLPRAEEVGRTVRVPVCYDAELAADLLEIAERTGLAPQGVADAHAGTEHRVLMVGFAPGQPYIGGLDPRLSVPRRATPRPRVPAGSVAIANAQSVVYPHAIAGGWSIIGRTPLQVFDPQRESPSLFAAGDRVRFVPISRAEFDEIDAKRRGEPPS